MNAAGTVCYIIGDMHNERPAHLHREGWAGHISDPIVVIGETPKRYRIRFLRESYAPGKRWRLVGPDTVLLVPKHAVTFDPPPRPDDDVGLDGWMLVAVHPDTHQELNMGSYGGIRRLKVKDVDRVTRELKQRRLLHDDPHDRRGRQ